MRLGDDRRILSSGTAPLSSFSELGHRLNVDGPLLGGLLLICGFGLFVLYSAAGENSRLLVNPAIRLGVALAVMLIVAQLPPDFLLPCTPWGYLA